MITLLRRLMFGTKEVKVSSKIKAMSQFPDANPNPVIKLDSSGRVIYANQMSSRILKAWGVERKQEISKKWKKIIVDEVLRRNSSKELSVEYDGYSYIVLVLPIASEDCVNIYGQDHTKRVMAEVKLHALNKQLNDEVRIRTEELEAKILQEKKLRRELEDSKETLEVKVQERTQRFQETAKKLKIEINKKEKLQEKLIESARLAGMAETTVSVLHNIGNVLTGLFIRISSDNERILLMRIANILQKLASGLDQGQKIDMMQVLQNVSQEISIVVANLESNSIFFHKQLSLISDIISTQQNIAAGSEILVGRTNFRRIVDDCLKMQSNRFQKHNISVDAKMDDCHIVVDKYGLSQVVVNIVINAVESIKERNDSDQNHKGIITIRLTSKHDISSLSISDNGIGIPKEEQIHIFNFGHTTKSRSSGFGLHNSANFVRSQSGSICVISDGYQHGAEFIVKFPLAKE